MRVALALFLLAAASAAGGTAPAATTDRAALRIVDASPVTVQGLRFRAGERVRVVLSAKERHVRTVRANRSGSFVARFAVYADLCAALNLRATGASGRVAVTGRRPPPQCAALDPAP